MNAIEELERFYDSEPSGDGWTGKAGVAEPGSSAQRSASERDGLSPATDGQASTSAVEDDVFITHMVSKSDTLAGLAVQYNVAVSDIKRANGLMSENMMWCRCASSLCFKLDCSSLFARRLILCRPPVHAWCPCGFQPKHWALGLPNAATTLVTKIRYPGVLYSAPAALGSEQVSPTAAGLEALRGATAR